jgi:hypothetical protein
MVTLYCGYSVIGNISPSQWWAGPWMPMMPNPFTLKRMPLAIPCHHDVVCLLCLWNRLEQCSIESIFNESLRRWNGAIFLRIFNFAKWVASNIAAKTLIFDVDSGSEDVILLGPSALLYGSFSRFNPHWLFNHILSLVFNSSVRWTKKCRYIFWWPNSIQNIYAEYL